MHDSAARGHLLRPLGLRQLQGHAHEPQKLGRDAAVEGPACRIAVPPKKGPITKGPIIRGSYVTLK